MTVPTLKLPSAFIPVVMSFAALVLVFGHVAFFGIVHEADEGTSAHLFQLLLVAQLPVIAYFTIKWLPQSPKRALLILAMQGATALAAIAAVIFLT